MGCWRARLIVRQGRQPATPLGGRAARRSYNAGRTWGAARGKASLIRAGFPHSTQRKDSVGSTNTPPTFFDRLRDSGINVLAFNPVNPLLALDGQRHLNHRDHRKILVVDGSIAFTGGVNICHVYSNSLSGRAGGNGSEERKRREAGEPWRDTHVQIQGPAVAEFQKLFLETWKEQGPGLPERDYFPPLQRKGSNIVQVIGSTPGELNWVTFIRLRFSRTAVAEACGGREPEFGKEVD